MTSEKKHSFTGVGIFLILICQFWAVASIVARKLFLRLSEIEQVFYPTQYYFEETIFEKYNEAFSKALNYYLGTAADAITSKIPDNVEARRPSVLLDYGAGAQEIKKVEFEESDTEAKIVVAAKNPAKFVATSPVGNSPKALSDKGDSKVDRSAEIKYIDMKNEIDRTVKRWSRAMKKGDTAKATLIESTDIQAILDKGFFATYDRRRCKVSIKQRK